MFNLKNKTAVITGAASGIGQAIAFIFAKQGASVFLLDMNEQGLQQTVKQITDTGGTAQAHTTDVTNQAAIKLLFNKVSQIDENSNILDIFYTPDNSRIKTVLKANGQVKSKHFIGNYEKTEIQGSPITKEIIFFDFHGSVFNTERPAGSTRSRSR